MDDFNDEAGWAGWFAELIGTEKHLKTGLHWASSLGRTLLLRSATLFRHVLRTYCVPARFSGAFWTRALTTATMLDPVR